MPKNNIKKIIVGLDIGSSKICVIVAEVSISGVIQILAAESSKSAGLHRGNIINIQLASDIIQETIKTCIQKTGIPIDSVYVGLSGHHVYSVNHNGITAIRSDKITEADVTRVIETARAHNFSDKEILHTLNQEYIIDGQEGIKTPIGMNGNRLESKIHLVLATKNALANVTQCCNLANINVEGIILDPLASSLSVLTEEEKELGVALIDIGYGTSDLIIYKNGYVTNTGILTLGGSQIINDITIGLRITKEEALKLMHIDGTALISSIEPDEVIQLKAIANRHGRLIKKKLLAQVIEARCQEIADLLNKQIKTGTNKSTLGAGVVITGGTSLLHGFIDICENTFHLPTRIARPLNFAGLSELVDSPACATATGLIKYAANSVIHNNIQSKSDVNSSQNNNSNNNLKIKGLFKGFFDIF